MKAKFPFELASELSGAFGDFGTLIPILVSLSVTNQVNLTASLVFGGVFNIVSGLYFQIPMCVQPMKSIAAIALLANLSNPEIASAALSVSIFLILFATTGLMKIFNSLIPLYLIRGIQLGTGLTLISKGISNIQGSKGWSFIGYDWGDNYLASFFAFCIVMIFWRSKWSISAFLLFGIGIIISCIKSSTVIIIGPQFKMPFIPTLSDFWIGFIKAGLGQLPLTISNSVIAVSILADDLFPDRAVNRTDVTRVSIWVASMNLICVWFGSIPYCCGSGGFAAQYRFGARTGSSVIFLGVLKIFTGLMFGNSLLTIFKSIPNSIIGILLVVSGLQISLITAALGSYASNEEKEDGYLCMIITATSIVGFANDGIGFLIGVITSLFLFWSRELNPIEIAEDSDFY